MALLFDNPATEVWPVFNGSASNGLALSACVRGFESILAHEHSHINHDETGLPEFYTGAKIVAVKRFPKSAWPKSAERFLDEDARQSQYDEGKITPEACEAKFIEAINHAPHTSRPRVISLTQVTESGTAYSLEDIAAFAQLARKYDAYVHMDGARLGNAVASLGCRPADIVKGVDILSFGGTKAGAMMAEAVVIFNPKLADHFAYRHKRVGQLPSKMRYVSAQLLALLEDDLWLSLARTANQMAQNLAIRLKATNHAEILYPVQGNSVFVRLPPQISAPMLSAGHRFYPWPQCGDNVFRFVTSFMTTDADIDALFADV
jgi:threonine aldolase